MTTDTPQVETPTPAPTPAPVDDSLSGHEETFGREARQAANDPPDPDDEPTRETVTVPVERAKDGTFKPVRHRAPKDVASAEDVPRIRELTRKLREAEAEVTRLRTPSPVSAEPGAQATPHASPATAKPTWAQFEEQIGTTYDTWATAQDAYADARDDWRSQQSAKQSKDSQLTAAETATDEARKAIKAEYDAKTEAFVKTHPDFQDKLNTLGERLTEKVPDTLWTAILTADNGPELVYHFASNPDFYDEIALLAVSLPVNEQSVALLQRRLKKAAEQTVTTGSVASQKPRLTPRPPNPVRTGPMNTGDELPGDASSLAEHEKAFGRKRRF